MRLHSRNLNVIPYSRRGTGDLVPGQLLTPWNPLFPRPGMGDLVPGQLLTPWNPLFPRPGMSGLRRGVGCASCGDPADAWRARANGMGDLSTVGTDLSAGNFSQAWTDLQSYMTTLSPTFGPYIVPGALIAGAALLFMGASSGKGRHR